MGLKTAGSIHIYGFLSLVGHWRSSLQLALHSGVGAGVEMNHWVRKSLTQGDVNSGTGIRERQAIGAQ